MNELKSKRVALLCPGLGRVHRGYERFAAELFQFLREKTSIVLYKGAGSAKDGEVVVSSWHRDGNISAALERLWKDRFFWEDVSFGVMAWPRIIQQGFNVIHYSEPALNSLFTRLERFWGEKPRRLFSHGVNMDPEHCLRCHHLHQVSPVAYEQALDFGIPKDRMTLLPYGLDTSQFPPVDSESRLELRKKYGMPLDSIVILCVAALNRQHKRVDRLIHAMASLKKDYHLLLCGKIEDESIIVEAKTLLKGKFTHLYVPQNKVGEIYNIADLFVLPSLIEGFGLVVMEAALSGLPVLVHHSAHFQWMLGPRWHAYADMSSTEGLTEPLRIALSNLPELKIKMESIRHELVERFDWSNLVPSYLKMYNQAAKTDGLTIAEQLARC
jgi:glycosyltransferase involved in cell wall biosynthesis